jgi:two-component system chemotaxis sensor kinase CheA
VRDDLLKLSLLLNKRVVQLEESIIDARLEPISILFDRYRGEVRRLAKGCGKTVRLNFEGQSTRVDRAMLSRLYDPLLHLIRNAVDHGIETGPVRRAAGKPEEGNLTLRARQEASHVRIDIEDDGSGIDSDRVRKAAREKGFGAGGDQGPMSAIFLSGVSTKEDVTDISGRGVGLDVVKTRVEAMRGMIDLETSAGIGTRFSIWVPLTLAVSRGILLNEGDVPVVMPLASVLEVTSLTRRASRDAQENGILTHNGDQIQVVDLSRMLGTAKCPDVRSAVILGIGREKRALISERVCGETEIVSRPLPQAASAPGYIAGASELHDGRPAIVIQPEELLRASVSGARRGAKRWTQSHAGAAAFNKDLAGGDTLPVLIFNSGSGYRGLPLRLLKEILPTKARTRLPVLGGQWLGLFFVRGLCHGLLSPEAEGQGETMVARSAAILESPERCGVAIGNAIGHFDIPLESLRQVGRPERPGLISPFAEFTWDGNDVMLLDAGGVLSECLAHPAIP